MTDKITEERHVASNFIDFEDSLLSQIKSY